MRRTLKIYKEMAKRCLLFLHKDLPLYQQHLSPFLREPLHPQPPVLQQTVEQTVQFLQGHSLDLQFKQ